ncbi:MAG: glycerol-3-phosphate acyltransferase [Clostridia bacterium]|nr:glycerol-3-phosphate acyltransferase [Clostridia bacterium]
MKVTVLILAAVCSYLLSGVNLSIILSNAIYHTDIREVGSKNPGFTNFKRSFGGKYAWLVMAFDLLKAALPCVLFGFAFEACGMDRQFGTAYAGAFSMLGHAFPVYYRFKGGKGFLVCLAAVWALDWRSGAIAAALLVVLLLTVKYMSLSTMCALTAGAVSLYFFSCDLAAALLYSACVLFMIFRHKENIKRLVKGTESKFILFRKKSE